MALQFNTVAEFANGLVKAEVQFNTQNLSITQSRITNNSDFPAHLDAVLNPSINGFSVVGVDSAAHTTQTQNFPNNVLKYTDVIDPDDGSHSLSLIGVSIFCRWPA